MKEMERRFAKSPEQVRDVRRWLDGLIGTRQPVLIENGGKGHADNFAPVAIEGSARGDLGNARITGCDGDRLTAVWA